MSTPGQKNASIFSTTPGLLAACLGACFLWGSAFPCIKIGYGLFGIDASDVASIIAFAGVRFLISGTMVTLAMSVARRRPYVPARADWTCAAKLSVFQTSLQYLLFYVGLSRCAGVTSSVIEASSTFFIVLLAVYAFRTERMTARKAVGCVVGFAGVLLVNLGGSAAGGMSFSLGGEGLVFLSTISAAVSSNLSKRYSREHDPVLISGWQFVIGGATLLVLGLAMAGLHLADLLLWSEADTGFAASGSVWLRYIPWLAAFALPYLPARRAAAQPAGLQDTNKPLGVCMALAGAALLASGVAAGNTARYAILYPEVLSGSCPVWAAWADLLLPIFAGAWLLNYAVRAFSGFGLQRQRLGSSLLAGAVPLVFLWRLIWRFQFAPASLCRMPCTLRVLSAAAALLLAVVLIKIFLVPGLPCGHTLYAAGTGAFLLCTGLELPQTLFEAARGMLTLPDLLTGIGIGLFGLCGLVCAWEACGKETE